MTNLYNQGIKKIMLFAFFVALFTGCSQHWIIQNPYESVNWTEHRQYKANFHTHTTHSDGRMNPQEVVDRYHKLGYDILAITDHNEVTYPWTGFSELKASKSSLARMESDPGEMPESLLFENRDPDALGMIDVKGNELSRHHHMGSFFNDHSATRTEEESLDSIAAKKGIAILFHPGRNHGSFRRKHLPYYTLERYIELFQQFDHLIGVEVYNAGDRYPEDRRTWDSMLIVTMPDRPIWGYSDDDMHLLANLGHNWNMLILPELTDDWVRKGMQNGLSYFIYAPNGHDGPPAPAIERISVNPRKGTIEIAASECDSIHWIANGKVVDEVFKVNLNDLPEEIVYVRAELYGKGETVAGTQPFGIRKKIL